MRTVIALALVGSGCSISRPDVTGTSTVTPSSTPFPADLTADLTLDPDGIGPFSLGDEAVVVLEGISAIIGGWDVDSADDVTGVQLPDCAGGTPRVVAWGSLALVFTGDADREVLTSWSYGFDPLTGNSQDLRQLGLVTAAGIGLESTRAELTDAYGGAISLIDQPSIDSATFTIDADTTPHLSGKLDAAGPGGIVDLIQIEPTC